MDFEKEIPVEDFDTDFDTKELTPIKSLRSDPPPQYFTNIDGKYCKDVAGREELDELKALVDDIPWQPLEDGYTNFWFELTNDTLSPWLNFSAKTNDAVIDWGDGSGEVALDTLTPTHTYAKAGKYVVKVKGVTEISVQQIAPYTEYMKCLTNIETNNEVTILSIYSLRFCTMLKNVVFGSNLTIIPQYNFQLCANLTKVNIPSNTTIGNSAFYSCVNLKDITIGSGIIEIPTSCFFGCYALPKITIPSSVSKIGNQAFQQCSSLIEIHCKPTSPPTLGTNVFQNIASNFIIYVPVGYGETYKAASGWSTYADHILEEGQTPNRAMLAKFNTDEPQDDMR